MFSKAGRFQMIATPKDARIQDELIAGQRAFNSRFCNKPRSLKAGELLVAGDAPSDVLYPPVYRLRAGWACQFRKLSDGRQAILDVYLPGNVIGLDAALHTRPFGNVVALTSIAMDAISAQGGLFELVAHRQTALYVVWLLGQRQRRADRLLAAISSLDARGRLALMIFDFYKRLHAQKLVSSQMYNLPLTQGQIGSYLGLTVVHVNRVLRTLRDDQVVNVEKHCVTILNLEKLVKLAQYKENMRQLARTGLAAANEPAVQAGYS